MSTHKNISLKICALLSIWMLQGCGSSAATSTTTNFSSNFKVNGITNAATSLFTTLNLQEELLDTNFESGSGLVQALTVAGDLGQNGTGTSSISSLQFYVASIQLCPSLTVTGSGYSNSSTCVTAFGTTAASSYDTYKVANAIADTTSTSWVDLMSKTSISTFATTSAASVAANTYNYVIIETRKPVRLNAQFSTGNASNLRTCAGGTITSTGSGTSLSETSTVSNMLTCTRGLATFGNIGGGKWFKFQQPVTINSTDTYVLDLAYNADNAIVGGITSALIGGNTYYTDGTYGFNAPSLSVSPVLRKSSQSTIREEYTIPVTGLTGSLVVDLYFVGAKTDVGTGTIIGAQINFVNSASATTLTSAPSPYSITTTGSTIAINDYTGTAIVSGLTRSTTQTSGGTQSLTVNTATILTSGGSNVTATATYNGIVSM